MPRKVNFQKRHFEFIAMVIRQLPEPCRQLAANEFRYNLKSTNPNFDGMRFIDACRTEAGKVVQS